MKGPFQLSLADERALREAIRRRGTTVLHLGQHSIAIRSTPFSHDIDLRVRDITDRDCPAPPVIYRDQNQPALLYIGAADAITRHINRKAIRGAA